MTAALGPIARESRVVELDVLRGVAIFGILVANMVVTSGYFFLSLAERSALPTAAVDPATMFGIHALVEGKFYSIFSLLFGIGFGLQLQRAAAGEASFPAHFRRRMTGLLVIGLIHSLLLWAGDILLLYALLGFLLLPFRRLSDRALLRAAVICLALPVVVYLPMLALGAGQAMADGGAGQEEFFRIINDGLRGESWVGAFRANLYLLAGRWFDLFLSVRFPKVFGMFLLGLYLVRRGIGLTPGTDRPLLRRVVFLAVLVGLPANAAMAWLAEQEVYFPASGLGLLYTVVAAIGLPLLALGIAALVVLALGTPTGQRWLVPVGAAGRMALTNYLTHSVVMTAIFYGWGLGWYGRVGPALTTVVAIGVCLVQVPLSRWWLDRHRFGPVEWLWRQGTYHRRLPLRRAEVA